MKKIDFGQAVQLLANLAVFVGIVFLAYEVRQNTLATQLTAVDTYTAEMLDADYFIASNQEFAEIMLRSFAGEELSPTEQFRLNLFAQAQIRQWQSAYYRYRRSALDEQFLRQMRNQIQAILTPGSFTHAYWESRKARWDPEFNEFIESVLADSQGQ